MNHLHRTLGLLGIAILLGNLVACSQPEATMSTSAPAANQTAAEPYPQSAKLAPKRVAQQNLRVRPLAVSPIANTGTPVLSQTSSVQQSDRSGTLNREGYKHNGDNPFQSVSANPLSTFSIDVDAASYSNIRRFINQGQLPPTDAVRLEEMINYFSYDYPSPDGDKPFSVTTEVSDAPWNPKHKLVQIGLQSKQISTENLPPNNLVFLLDVSGSMEDPNKLPLLKSALRLLVNEARDSDKVAIVVYAGNAGLVLPSTPGSQKDKIFDAIEQLAAGGSTAGGEGIQLAYKIARENFLRSGNNRIILATDGDFNVGVTSDEELVRLIEKEREQGIFLTVLGFGTGNLQDAKMEQLADKGNGNYAYIDSLLEAKKVLVKEMGATLLTIAKDVKIQVEFNPTKVQGYRLIGYENRMLADRDFNDDKKDAGELGAGHSVTALYEIIPTGVKSDVPLPQVDSLKYQQKSLSNNDEIMQVKLRYKQPSASTSQLLTYSVVDRDVKLDKATTNFRFASAVAEFGMLLRNSPDKGSASFEGVLQRASQSQGTDLDGYRAEFIRLVEKSKALK
jgi:Ca-activated chloride channel homolog